MNLRLILTFLLTSLTFVSAAKADPKYYMYKKMMHDRAQRERLVVEGNGVEGSPELAPEAVVASAQKLDQPLDHFAAVGTAEAAKTFKQRYYVDSTYASGQDAPVIYYLCGEAACDGATNTELVNTIAQKYRGYRVALEHRYYGQSLPFSSLTTANLAYLSMDQAVEDLAYFQKFISAKLGLRGKWIVVGGSYAGELAAFYRLKHPELVVGALASSGPVLAKADFFEYDRHVARVVPPACLAAIKTVVKDIETKLLQPATATQVKSLFNATMLTNNVDFLYVVADMAATAIQYGYQDDFCNALSSRTGLQNPTQAYATIGNKVFSDFGTSALQDAFQGSIDTSTTGPAGQSGMRQWYYQSCTEFGYWQTANPNVAESSRSQQITLQYHNEACMRMFGINTPVDTAKTNRTFFNNLASPSVTHIFFTNGQNDPWSNLSLTATSSTASANPNLNFFTIADAAHCDDLGSRTSAALASARSQFDTFVSQWLAH